MRILIVFLILFVAGCGAGVYKIPQKDYQQQVKTLGVLPVMVDAGSPIRHPAREEIIALLRQASAGQSEQLVEDLRKKKGYFDIRLVQQPARLVAEKLLIKGKVNELGQPAGYELEPSYLAELCRDAVVDGLLLITLRGAQHNEKRWSRNTFESLTTEYSDIMASASVISADGQVLWEMTGADATTILALEYADFDEAYFNKTDAVKLKFIGLEGLKKELLQGAEGEAPKKPLRLEEWLKKVASALSPSLFR